MTPDAFGDAFAAAGFAVWPGFLAAGEVRELAATARAQLAAGEFRPAAIGRGDARQRRSDIRGDDIRWLDALPHGERFDAVREAVNAATYLGLFELEAHFARYPIGAFYRRHRDVFAGQDGERVVSMVLYLNEGWGDGDGGELRLYLDEGARDVKPEGGTLVAFLSERFEHEVLPAKRERLSLTGWFRRRPVVS